MLGSSDASLATSRYAATAIAARRSLSLLLLGVAWLNVGFAVLDCIALVAERTVPVDVDVHPNLALLALAARVRRGVAEAVLVAHQVGDRLHVSGDLAREREREIGPAREPRERLQHVVGLQEVHVHLG